jgi:hypothetical protein
VGPLKNPRWENFCQELFKGEPASTAYEKAGYQFNEGNAIRLKGNEKVQARLMELQAAAQRSSEVTVQSLMAELDNVLTRATTKEQYAAAVGALREKIKLSGLLVQKIEVRETTDFSDCNSVPAIVERLSTLIGPEATQALASYFGVDEKGGEVVKSASFVPIRRKFGRGQYQQQLEQIIRNAIPPDEDDVEILPDDIMQLRGLIRQFDELVRNVRARSARVVNAVDPAEIEHKKMIVDRNRTFNGGNGRQR